MPRAFAPHAGRRTTQPLSMRRDLDLFGPASPQDYFYHQDDLFNVVALTNTAGSIVERVTYGDYGFPTINDANGAFAASESTVGNPFLFTGREWDAEFRFYHYRTRSMDPMLGRFTTRDRMGMIDGPNLNAAVGSNPSTFTDATGEAYSSCTILSKRCTASKVLSSTPWGVVKMCVQRRCEYRCYCPDPNNCYGNPCKRSECTRNHGVNVLHYFNPIAIPPWISLHPMQPAPRCADMLEWVKSQGKCG